jgi:CheY-like chemotaxis protein
MLVATVLLVSDLASLRRELETMLAGPDLSSRRPASGVEAIERVKRGDVDLVVVDLQVGTMGGMAITMELRNLESYGGADRSRS